MNRTWAFVNVLSRLNYWIFQGSVNISLGERRTGIRLVAAGETFQRRQSRQRLLMK